MCAMLNEQKQPQQQQEIAVAAAAGVRGNNGGGGRKRKDWRNSATLQDMFSCVQKAHRISLDPVGRGSYCLGMKKTIARFKQFYPHIPVTNKVITQMTHEFCSRRTADERLLSLQDIFPQDSNERQRTMKIHSFAVDTLEEFGLQYLLHHHSQSKYTFAIDMEKNGQFWVLVELLLLSPPPSAHHVESKNVYISTSSRLFPHDVDQVLFDFKKRLVIPPKSMIIIDGNKHINIAKFSDLQRRLLEGSNSWVLLSHPWGVRFPVQGLVERKVRLVKQLWKQNPEATASGLEMIINKK